MKPLIDADILRYEIGFASATGWKAVITDRLGEDLPDEEYIPNWDYVEKILLERINAICVAVDATELPAFFLTEGKTFRDEIATVKPYKGTRKSEKPWHYNNLSVYLRDVLGAVTVDGLEADDVMALESIANPDTTIICSRDKDLRQVPGWLYSWELGHQPAFGPVKVEQEGTLIWDPEKKKLSGTGLAFFYAQCLMGDNVDNIPGLPKCGPVKAWNLLTNGDAAAIPPSEINLLDVVCQAYLEYYGKDEWYERLREQGRLLWMTRRLNEDGSPVLWEIGMEA